MNYLCEIKIWNKFENKLRTGRRQVAVRSRRGPRLVADQSPTSFSDSHAPILTKLVGDRSATSRRLIGDWSATSPGPVCDQISRSQVFVQAQNLAATDLVATRSPISRRLLCNLAGTDRGPCCDLCDRWKLSVAERSQSGCNVCLTGVLLQLGREGLAYCQLGFIGEIMPCSCPLT